MLLSVRVCQLLLDDPYGGDPDRSCLLEPLNMREMDAKKPFFFLPPPLRMLDLSDPALLLWLLLLRPSAEKVRRNGCRPVGGRYAIPPTSLAARLPAVRLLGASESESLPPDCWLFCAKKVEESGRAREFTEGTPLGNDFVGADWPVDRMVEARDPGRFSWTTRLRWFPSSEDSSFSSAMLPAMDPAPAKRPPPRWWGP